MNNELTLSNKVLLVFIGMLALSAIILINHYSPYIPDYDGLSYFQDVKIFKEWQFNNGELAFSSFTSFNNLFNYWPITNGVSVFIASIFYDLLDRNLIPSFINIFYLAVFVIYISKVRALNYAVIAALLLCSTSFFYRLFTTLTSEFSVGLWIFAFLLTLITSHPKRGVFLSGLVIIGLFLRTIDIVFILCTTTAYSVLHFLLYKDKRHVLTTLSYLALTLLLTLPLFWGHYYAAFRYVLESQVGVSSASWKAMAGVADRLDVTLQYIHYLNTYNAKLIPLMVLTVFYGLIAKSLSNRLVIMIVGIAFALILPLLMAQYLNVMTVFWVFVVFAFVLCEVGFNLLPILKTKSSALKLSSNQFSFILFLVIITFTMPALKSGWRHETKFLANQKEVSEIAFEISKILNKVEYKKYITANFRGVGALDNTGLSWGSPIRIEEGSVKDIYSKKEHASYYLNFNEQVSFFISAHDNYFFPLAFGINEHVKAIHHLFEEKADELGFRKIALISKNNFNFDIWYRPSAQANLEFINYGDHWIATQLPVEIGNQSFCSGQIVSGFLHFSVDFSNPKIANFQPPFNVSLVEKSSGKTVSSTMINHFGPSDFSLKLNKVDCAQYYLVFDKTFSTKKDARKLSAQFINLRSALKFDLSKKGSE